MSQQNPQLSRPVQSPQVRLVVHGSALQVVPSQSQSPQVPAVGPDEVPDAHVPVLEHQPQVAREVHESQSVALEHASPPPPHDDEYQSQSAQVAPLGPLYVPVAHVLVDAHQPQVAMSVQSPQLVALAQGSASVRQVPSTQLSPEQQSASAVQVCEPLRQVQRPALQLIEPQQSASPVHVPADSTQQVVVLGAARQLRPVQQSVVCVQLVRAEPQLATGLQVPLVQARPLRHGVPLPQQASPSPPHTASHVPPVQVLGHAVPHAPQWRASFWRLAHEPLQQPSPPSQTFPAQQASPVPPHASATV